MMIEKHDTDNITKFLVYCIEIYKTANKKTGKEIIKIFTQYGIFEYIVNYYGALHTTGPQYIINDIDALIAQRTQEKR